MFTMRPYHFFTKYWVFLIILLGNGAKCFQPWQSDFSVKHPACDTRECSDHVKYLLELLNPKVNPCNDFYDYVCGKWEKKYPVSGYYPEWSVDMLMATQAFERLKDILESRPIRQDTFGLKQAKALYHACMNIPFLGILNARELRPYVQEVNYFPLFMKKGDPILSRKMSWLELHNYYLSITGESAFFSIHIKGDKNNYMKPMLDISRMKSPFGLIESFEVLTVPKLRLYKEFLMALINHLIPANMYKVSHWLIEKRLLDVLVFRRMLSKIARREDGFSEPTDDCNPMSLQSFDDMYSNKALISWSKIIYALYKNAHDPFSITTMKICIDKTAYFQSLISLLNSTLPDIVVNHIHLYFIERHLQLTPHLKELLLKVVIHDGRLEEKIRYLGKKHVKCIISSERKEAFGRAYITKYFPVSTKKEGEVLVNVIKDMMGIQINESTWLDYTTIEKATETIYDMKMAIGYPEYYDDPSLRTEYKKPNDRVQPVSSDAFYSPRSNRLSISAAYFNTPLYHPMFPLTVVYGTIGSFIGHEMYHAFSTSVLHCKSLPTCWSEKMLARHTEKSMCFVKQYDKRPVKELKHIPNAPTLDGRRTLDENISDVMGLNVAYWAFRKEIWKTKRCPMLKDLPDITCEQLFFISYAMTFCSSMTIDRMMEMVQYDKHSPARFRVNGAVENMKEFSKAFKCSPNAPMNPPNKCNLWK